MAKECPLCNRQVEFEYGRQFDGDYYYCPACGDFGLTFIARDDITKELRRRGDVTSLLYVSAYTRELTERRKHSEYRLDPLPILVTSLRNVPPQTNAFLIGVDEILARAPRTISERLDKALVFLKSSSKSLGAILSISDQAFAALYAENFEAAKLILSTLNNRGYFADYNPLGGTFNLTLSADGWDRAEELRKGKPGEKPLQAFVAMWFDHDMEEAHVNGLAAGIKDAGYEPLRIDSKEHNNRIDDEMIAEIRKSKFLVADFTGQRGGVYYEAGFAEGLGMEVIKTCRKDHFDQCHFDTEHFNYIIWETPEELRTKLKNRIEATIGRPPAA